VSFQQSFEDVQWRRLTDRIRKFVPRAWACYGEGTRSPLSNDAWLARRGHLTRQSADLVIYPYTPVATPLRAICLFIVHLHHQLTTASSRIHDLSAPSLRDIRHRLPAWQLWQWTLWLWHHGTGGTRVELDVDGWRQGVVDAVSETTVDRWLIVDTSRHHWSTASCRRHQHHQHHHRRRFLSHTQQATV